VARDPRTASTATPPRIATYVRSPAAGAPNRISAPAGRFTGALCAKEPAHRAPVVTTSRSRSARRASPPNVTSRTAVPAALPTSRLANR
jgi:hypothetical protein